MAKPKSKDHVSCLNLAPLFEEAEKPGIFSVLEPRGNWKAWNYVEETVRRVTPRSSFRSVLRQQAVFKGGGSLEFFQVPGI